MPLRKVPLISGQIYHVFNRSLDKRPIFTNTHYSRRALETLSFYQYDSLPVKLSYFIKWSQFRKNQLLRELITPNNNLVSILCFCLMPNHFHLLLRQEKDQGISKFVGQFQNSFSKYYNTREERGGHVFSGQFKAVRIETDDQLIHVARYIHLNPYTSFVIKDINSLVKYPWSSFGQYISKTGGLCNPEIILSHFKNRGEYQKHIFDQAVYQRELGEIKHLILE